MNTAKGYIYSDCERCKGVGWLEDRADAQTVALSRCPACDGEGEVLKAFPLPDDWAPCTVCKLRCSSQLEHMEHNDGQPWPTCSNCGLPREVDDDEPTNRYELAPAPMQRAAASDESPAPTIPVRWFVEGRKR